MSRIRKVEIENFRGIKCLVWLPNNGVNCLIGAGDSGKSTILDAIDYCVGGRRSLQITDADFHKIDTNNPIQITLTIGALDDALKNIDNFGMYLRGFIADTGEVEDEPEKDAETVLTLRLTIENNLEPSWTLISDRAIEQDYSRDLSWSDRLRLAPTRVGAFAEYNLGWRRGSVLNRLTEERPDISEAIANAAREARANFGDKAKEQLSETLQIVTDTARELGIPVGAEAKAMLDAHSISVSGGTISLHDDEGIPLKGLGLGSTRLLITGMQRAAAEKASIVLVDELEHGLEPHRIMRLLGYLGAKDQNEPLQVFMTTHSPVALQELSGPQLHVVRAQDESHKVHNVGGDDHMQGTIRRYPHAFLAPSVIVCEGASEVGFLRGLDHFFTAQGSVSITASGVALVDAGGGSPDSTHQRGNLLLSLGYRVAILRDDDQKPTPDNSRTFQENGGTEFFWQGDRNLEQELFSSLSNNAIIELLKYAVELHGQERIANHINSRTENSEMEGLIVAAVKEKNFSENLRRALATASTSSKQSKSWFKQVGWMEYIGREIVGPDLENADDNFRSVIEAIFQWANDVG